MGETIHTAFNTYEYETIFIGFLAELVIFDDILWESFYLHAQKFWSVHGRVEVEIFEVEA